MADSRELAPVVVRLVLRMRAHGVTMERQGAPNMASKTRTKTLPWKEARALTKALTAAGCEWAATASGNWRTMDDGDTHLAAHWTVAGFYSGGVRMETDGNTCNAQPRKGAVVSVTIEGWAHRTAGAAL